MVASIDKASVVITILLSVFLLKESLTPKLIVGSALIVIGTFILAGNSRIIDEFADIRKIGS